MKEKDMFGKMFNRNKRQIMKEKDTFGKMLETLYFQHKGCNMTPTFFFQKKARSDGILAYLYSWECYNWRHGEEDAYI